MESIENVIKRYATWHTVPLFLLMPFSHSFHLSDVTHPTRPCSLSTFSTNPSLKRAQGGQVTGQFVYRKCP